ncbi:MAG TPA: tetratricopeptide repeat protein, partial [Phycisphaerae bacterium]
NETLFAKDVGSYPQAARLQNGVGKFFLMRGRARAALPHLKRAVEISPRTPGFYYDLSQVHAMLGAWGQAEESADAALKLSPTVRSYNQNLEDIQRLLGKANPLLQRPLPEAEKLAAERPDDFEAQYGLGLALVHAGKPVQAIVALRRAVALDSSREDAHLELAVQLITTERLPEALSELNLVVGRAPNNWRAHTNLAAVLARLQRADEALEHARTANRLAPGRIETWFNLAHTLDAGGHYEEALATYGIIRDGLSESDPQRALIEGFISDLERRRR